MTCGVIGWLEWGRRRRLLGGGFGWSMELGSGGAVIKLTMMGQGAAGEVGIGNLSCLVFEGDRLDKAGG